MMPEYGGDEPSVEASEPAEAGAVISAGSARSSSVSDKAAAEDLLGFKDYVDAIARFLKAPETEAPLTLSIEGEWGSGKSSFLLQLKRALEAGPAPAVVISFNAWRYDKQDELWAAFALHVTRGLREGVSVGRRYWGDLLLFFSRIKGVVGWLNLAGFLLLWALLLGGVGSLLFWSLHADARTRAGAVAALLPQKAAAAVTEVGKRQGGVGAFVLRHGPWAGSLALLVAALGHVGAAVRKRLLDFRLERFLDRPDYHGHAAFLEAFHEDFAKTLDAYVGRGPEKVYVLVDDLDRCDVPKAAELMQAINLMIGENPHLVFILAMDREKVASGIAYKYKDVLPYLAEYAVASGAQPAGAAGVTTTGPTLEDRVAFGHAFLEKFIQLSFRLPATDDEGQLRAFLERLSPAAPAARLSLGARLGLLGRQGWAWVGKRLAWAGVGRAGAADQPGGLDLPSGADAPGGAGLPGATAPQSFVEYCRMITGNESPDVVEVVLMVKDVFRSNPRRIKLFLNAYRLSFYLASGQGLFDRKPGSGVQPITIEQLGKFLALGMRCPGLYKKLEEEPGLLGACERTVNDSSTASLRLPEGLERSKVRELLQYGMQRSGIPYDEARYSLADFPVARMLRVLPFAAAPPGTTTILAGLIADLEAHLDSPARQRDPRLAKVAARAIEEKCVDQLIAKHASGRVLDIVVALGTAAAAVDPGMFPPLSNFEWLSLALVYLGYRGGGQADLVQHQALLLAERLVKSKVLDRAARERLRAALALQLPVYEREGGPEKNRLTLARAILARIAALDAPAAVTEKPPTADPGQDFGDAAVSSSFVSSVSSVSSGPAPAVKRSPPRAKGAESFPGSKSSNYDPPAYR